MGVVVEREQTLNLVTLALRSSSMKRKPTSIFWHLSAVTFPTFFSNNMKIETNRLEEITKVKRHFSVFSYPSFTLSGHIAAANK